MITISNIDNRIWHHLCSLKDKKSEMRKISKTRFPDKNGTYLNDKRLINESLQISASGCKRSL